MYEVPGLESRQHVTLWREMGAPSVLKITEIEIVFDEPGTVTKSGPDFKPDFNNTFQGLAAPLKDCSQVWRSGFQTPGFYYIDPSGSNTEYTKRVWCQDGWTYIFSHPRTHCRAHVITHDITNNCSYCRTHIIAYY